MKPVLFTRQKGSCSGFTLVEVMTAAILIGVIASVIGSFLIHAHQERMNTRIRRAANIEANALMEQAFWAVKEADSVLTNLTTSVQYLSSTLLVDTNGVNRLHYNLDGSNPDLTWSYDGRNYDKSIKLRQISHDNRDFADIEIYVSYDASNTNRSVTLKTERLLNE